MADIVAGAIDSGAQEGLVSGWQSPSTADGVWGLWALPGG